MSDNINRSYYAIIPANVRYDSALKPNEKLLYGEITALCNEKGYCWAGNGYFAELYGVTKATVSRWISNLSDNGYIAIGFDYVPGTRQISQRKVYIENQYPIDEKINTPIQKSQYPIDEKVKDNNTINNTININNGATPKRTVFKPPTVEDVSKYCLDRGNSIDPEAFIDFYTARGWLIGKNKMKDWKAAIRTWERRSNDKPKERKVADF